MTCYELDETITPVVSWNEHQTVIYADFTTQTIPTKFKTIIGNPPYVKQKTGNLYIRFVELCYEYLEDDGELIFIVPSDFIKQTSSARIIDTMTKHGSFTDFLFPHNERLFDGASIDVVAFRYEKGLHDTKALVNNRDVFCCVNRGIITFSRSEVSGVSLDSLFHVYVGIVSGRDEIYRVPFGNMELLYDKDRTERYIYTETFPTKNAQIDAHLEAHKQTLMERKIKKFSENNWYEWGAPRNISSIRRLWGQPCIYVRNMTRQQEVGFIGNVQYFGGALLCMVPKKNMTESQRRTVVDYLNSETFQNDYRYAGRFKIGHKQLSAAILPL